MMDIIRDKYKKSRGGYSRFLKLSCGKCNRGVAIYQKDGSGPLLRMYLDRIMYPENLVGLQSKKLSDISNLKCRKCGEILGVSGIYKKERRKCFRLFQGAVKKKVRKVD
jgi:hypothetical protein